MKLFMKICVAASTLVLSLTGRGYGQADPTATVSASPGWSPTMPWSDGTIHYALTASELLQFGYYGSGTVPATNLSGNIGYSNMLEKHPFSLVYSGGVLLQNRAGYGTQFYQNLTVSQGLSLGRWNMSVADTVSYSPQTLTTGLSGIPGVGDLGTNTPIATPTGTGAILTYGYKQLNNMLSGQIGRNITGRTSVYASAGWSKLYFLDGNGLDTDGLFTQVGVNHVVDARDTVGVSAAYSTSKTAENDALHFPETKFQTKGIYFNFSRLLSKTMSFNISAGPMWISSSGGQVIPSKLNYSLNAGLGYSRRFGNFGLQYSHGVNGGSGVQTGALADTISGNMGKNLTRDWMFSVSAAYSRTSSLLAVGPLSGITGASSSQFTRTFFTQAQVSRALGRAWSCFISYGASKQSIDSIYVGQNAFNGFSQTLGFGITFAPKATRLGEF